MKWDGNLPVLECSLHAIGDSLLSCFLQGQSFRLQPLAHSVAHILVERAVLPENMDSYSFMMIVPG